MPENDVLCSLFDWLRGLYADVHMMICFFHLVPFQIDKGELIVPDEKNVRSNVLNPVAGLDAVLQEEAEQSFGDLFTDRCLQGDTA